MKAAPFAPRRTPRQERSQTTVDAILEACGRIVDEVGLDRATTNRIAHVAGVSIGTLYQYFPGKKALLTALTERVLEEDLARVRRAVDEAEGVPLEEAFRRVLAAGFAFVLEQPRLFAWMIRYLPELGLLPAAEKLEQAAIRETRRLLESHRDELPGTDLDVLAVIGVGAVRGALLAVAREHPEWLEDGRFWEAAVDLSLGSFRAHRDRQAKSEGGGAPE